MTRSVLLVDDQVEFLQLLKARLGRASGLSSLAKRAAGSKRWWCSTAWSRSPDAALVDVEMPGMDGFQTAQRLRTLVPGLRVVLISASADTGYAQRAGAVGARFLAKRDLTGEAVLRLLDDDL